ncbi:sodium:solute symporter [Eubacteriales bacterium OttesenSCG-928-A19]|nr:sodium:solute symporter [Eubacteriales bacterium OttesenSCG-928-A19]
MRIAVLVLYVLMMAGVLVFSARKTQTLNDFFLGGGKVGPWFSAFSYGTSYFSAVIIIGYAGKIGWDHGLSTVWIGIGNALIGNLLAWKLLAGRANSMARELDVCTMPGFFEKRYNAKGMGLFSAVLIFVFLVPYSASVYQGLGYLFEAALGVNFFWCIVGISLLAGLYLFAGGYRATAISDFIQGCVMIVGIVLMVIFVVRGGAYDPETGTRGGLVQALARMGQIGGEGFNTLLGPKGKGASLIALVILTSVGTWGLPQMMHKFFAIRDQAAIRQATVISTAFCLLLAGGAYFAGSFGKQILGGVVPEGGLDAVMPTVFLSEAVAMPDVLIGLVVVLVLSASISTLTALVLSSSSAIAIDLCGALMPKLKPERQTLIMRCLCVVFVLLSLLIAFGLQNTPIVTLMAFSWGSLAGSFLAPFLYGLFWRRTTRTGAWAGMVLGLLTSLLAPTLGLVPDTVFGGVLAMIVSLVTVPVVSLLTQSSVPSAAKLVRTEPLR